MGYVEWHAMADRLAAKGQKQKLCSTCNLWRWRCEAEQCAHFKASKEENT